jgi:hypothetical protein
VKVLFIFFVKIGDNGRVRTSSDNGEVGTSSYIFDMFDACIEAFESTTELCIGGEVRDRLLIESKE